MTAEEVKAWRERMGWSQEQLADALGVHAMTVSKWERGEQDHAPYLSLALAELERRAKKSKRKPSR